MKQTRLIAKQFSSEGIVEILDLVDVKEHLYIDLTNTSFDTILASLTTQTRQYLEEITGLSLIDRVVTILVDYESSFTIPFGPITLWDSALSKTSINVFTLLVNNDDYEIEFGKFKWYSGFGKVKLIYEAGYTEITLPPGLKLAWLNEIARRFEHRGDSVIIQDTNELVQQYINLEWTI